MRCLLVACSWVVADALRLTHQLKQPEASSFEALEGEVPGYDVEAGGFDLDWAVTEAVQELHPTTVAPPRISGAAAADAGVAGNRNLDEDDAAGNAWSAASDAGITGIRHLDEDSAGDVWAAVADAGAAGNQHLDGRYWSDRRWHYGAHHKSGTVLLRYLAIEHIQVMGEPYCLSLGKYGFTPEGCISQFPRRASVWSWCNFTKDLLRTIAGQDPGPNDYRSQRNGSAHVGRPYWHHLRGVHIVRDPIAMAVSGYLYHLHNDDTPTPLQVIRNMSMADGLAEEARFVIETQGKEMAEVYSSALPWVMNVRFESFTQSSESFDEAAAEVYSHMLRGFYTEGQRKELARRVVKHDLHRNRTDDREGHVAKIAMKESVKTVVNAIPKRLLRALKGLRKELGYA